MTCKSGGIHALDVMVLAMPTLAELAGILSDPSKRPLSALFLASKKESKRIKMEKERKETEEMEKKRRKTL